MAELLQWWNLIFILPFIGALFYILMLCTGVVAADHDADFSVDMDHGADFHVDMDHDADFNADMGHGTGIEHMHDLDPGMLARALSFLGIGRVPLSIILISVCFLWGFAGFAGNTLLKPVLPAFLFVWISIAIALAVSIFCTRVLAAVLSRVLPATESYAVSIEQLTGKWAEAVTTIDETFGQAHVHDDAGSLHTVQCLVRSGESNISRGTQVILLFYDKNRNAFFVGTQLPVVKNSEDGTDLKVQG